MPPTWSIVIPMLDEAQRIPSTLEALAASALGDAEFIMVDDGSSDASVEVAARHIEVLGLNGRVVSLPHRGKGAAVVAGAREASGGSIVFIDADLSTDINSVERVAATLERPGVDIAIGSRRHRDSVIATRQPRPRDLLGRSFNLAVRALGLSNLRDTQCGLKAFTRSAAETSLFPVSTVGYCFDVEMLMAADRASLTVVEVPVRWHHDDGSAVRMSRDLIPVARELWRLRRARGG